MKVAKLQIKNFLSIGEVEVSPGKLTQIVGQNNQGKTSILRALEVAVKGGSDGSLVKRGETEAEIIVEFDDSTVIRRRIKTDGSSKVDVRKGNFKADKPQSLLDSMFSSGMFNPLELLDTKKRTEVLLSAIPVVVTQEMLNEQLSMSPVGVPPVDLDQHGLKVAQQAHKMLFARRAEANKDLKQKEETARVKREELPELPSPSDKRTPAEIQKENGQLEANIKAELAKEEKLAAEKKAAENAATWLRQSQQNEERLKIEIARLEEQLSQRQNALTVAREETVRGEQSLRDAQASVTASGPDSERIAQCNAEIQKNLKELTLRSQIETIKQRISHVENLEEVALAAQRFADSLDAAVKAAGAPFREKLISQAKLPIEGLTFENDEFFLDGCAIDNLSTSKAMALALAVARATAGEAKLICLDGAEALDEETWKMLRAQIENDDFQYFVTKVGEPFEGEDQALVMSKGEAS